MFIWEASAGQGPHWCVCVIWAGAAGDLGPPPRQGSFRMVRDRGNEDLLCGWEDLWLRMSGALEHLELG